MNSIELTPSYRLYSFPDYWSMRKVRDEFKKEYKPVVLAKELSEVKEIETKNYVTSYTSGFTTEYRNYLREYKRELPEQVH